MLTVSDRRQESCGERVMRMNCILKIPFSLDERGPQKVLHSLVPLVWGHQHTNAEYFEMTFYSVPPTQQPSTCLWNALGTPGNLGTLRPADVSFDLLDLGRLLGKMEACHHWIVDPEHPKSLWYKSTEFLKEKYTPQRRKSSFIEHILTEYLRCTWCCCLHYFHGLWMETDLKVQLSEDRRPYWIVLHFCKYRKAGTPHRARAKEREREGLVLDEAVSSCKGTAVNDMS